MNDTTATTFIGIDAHARSAAACAINGLTGEIERASFGAGYTAAEIAEWALGFDSPAAVYEAGCTGFWLARGLRELGVPCAVGAPSKMQRPPADARKKNDRSDAEFLARLLSMRNVREVAAFARFGSARAYCAWLGLEPSEHSSGGKVARGGITKTGNSLCRRLLVESAWHYLRAGEARKSPKGAEVPLPIENHAAKGVKPGDTYPPGILSAPLPISRHDRTTPYRSRRTPLRQTGRSSWQTSPYQAYRTHRPSQGASCIQILVSSSS